MISRESFLIAFLLSVASINLKAQTVNGLPIADVDVEYVEIVGRAKLWSNKIAVQIDFGQQTKFLGSNDKVLKDDKGIDLIFNSMVDALNFMSKNGYEFVTAYVITDSEGSERHYILRNKKHSTN